MDGPMNVKYYFLQHCEAHSGFNRPFVLNCGKVQSFEGVNNERSELVMLLRNSKARRTNPPALKNKISSA
jgi:hypothetical protein